MNRKGKGLLLYLVVFALILTLFNTKVLQSADNYIQDSIYQKLSIVSPDIYVIGIDEETLKELGPFQTWSRNATADLIELLTEDSDTAPAVIGIDIGFYGEGNKEEDERLAEVVKNAGNVILSSFASFGTQVVESQNGFFMESVTKTLEEPFPALLSAAKGSGHTNVVPDIDGLIRRSLHSINYDGRTVYSFAYEVYKAYTGNEIVPPMNQKNQWYISYAGKPMDYYGSQGEGSSFIRVLHGEYPKEMFAGSVVLIGPYSAGMMDSYYTPVDRSVQMNGVEIHANVLQALLEENFKNEVSDQENGWILIGFCILTALITKKFDFRIAGIFAVILTSAYLWFCSYMYEKGIVLSILYVVSAIWIIYILGCFYQYWQERKERKRMMEIYSRYLSPQIAKNIAVEGEGALRLGGQKKDIAVLFVDIRQFTTISETLMPEQVVEFLNHYLNLTTSSVFENEGTLDKFVGDATMAIFNAPFDLTDYVYKAVKTGLDMVEGAKALQKELTLESGQKIDFGVGIHCGEAIVGNIGASFRMEYTAIGDTVNTASRLEGLAKGGEVLISKEVFDRLKGRIEAECLGEKSLKGKASGFTVYRVVKLLG